MLPESMMPAASAQFMDRRDAGQRLAAELKLRGLSDPVVLALPRGGVPVGYEVARALEAPLDVLLVRKLGAPGHEEFGIGAVVDGAHPQVVLNAEAIETLRVSPAYLAQEQDRQLQEIERRRRLYGAENSAPELAGHTVIVVDDGVATGGTVLVAIRALKNTSARRVVLAIPLAPPETLAKLMTEADEVICLAAPSPFRAVSLHYVDFDQTPDEEVIALLNSQRAAMQSKRDAH
jgi:putative phosphoribosyl transferase